MEVYINGEKTEASIENEKTVGEVLQSFALEFETNKARVICIKLNEEQITSEDFESVSEKTLTHNEKFELDVVTEDAVKDSFHILSDKLVCVAEATEQVPSLFINGKGSDANDTIKKIADVIDQFCHLATLASLFPESFGSVKINNLSFNEFFNDFSPILSDFEKSLESQDTVLSGDLCEYEICPRLHEMAKALSSIK